MGFKKKNGGGKQVHKVRGRDVQAKHDESRGLQKNAHAHTRDNAQGLHRAVKPRFYQIHGGPEAGRLHIELDCLFESKQHTKPSPHFDKLHKALSIKEIRFSADLKV